MNDSCRRQLLWCMLILSALAVPGFLVGIAATLSENKPPYQPPRDFLPSGNKEVGLAARGIIDSLVSLSTLVFYNRDTPGWTTLFDNAEPGAALRDCNIVGVFNEIPDNLQLQEETLMGSNVFTVKFNSSMQAVAECVLNIIKAENKAWNDSIAASEAAAKNTVLGLGAASVVVSCLALVAGLMLIREYYFPDARRNMVEAPRILPPPILPPRVSRFSAAPYSLALLGQHQRRQNFLLERIIAATRALAAQARRLEEISLQRATATSAVIGSYELVAQATNDVERIAQLLEKARRRERVLKIVNAKITSTAVPAKEVTSQCTAAGAELSSPSALNSGVFSAGASVTKSKLSKRPSTAPAQDANESTPLLPKCAPIADAELQVPPDSFVLSIGDSGPFRGALPTDPSAGTSGAYSQSTDSSSGVATILLQHTQKQIRALEQQLRKAEEVIASQESARPQLAQPALAARTEGQAAAQVAETALLIAELVQKQNTLETALRIF